jgi:glutathione synthase/RimK-type ligase-like ATP-grasp enzyme
MSILILSSEDDAHAVVVHKQLIELGEQVIFLRYEEFLPACNFSLRLGQGGDRAEILHNAKSLNLSSVTSVWHRRPGWLVSDAFPLPWINNFVEQEAKAALDALLFSSERLWVNHPDNDRGSFKKLAQLKTAGSLGLTIPRTLVTNRPEDVVDFYHECSGSVIYKSISESSNFAFPQSENPRGISTLPLRVEDLNHISQVSFAPHLFQENIQKSYELRITIVGERPFCLLIDSQSGSGKTDWRTDYSVRMERTEVPDAVIEVCKKLMRHFGLNYSAIDMAVTPQGEYVFFEMNCAGQFLWVEDRTEMPIARELAKLLSHRAPPLISEY